MLGHHGRGKRDHAGWRAFIAAIIVAILVGAPAAAQESEPAGIRARIDSLRENASRQIGGSLVHRSPRLADLYERRGFAPIWTDPARAADLERAIRASFEDGLDPGQYHLAAISELAGRSDPASAADLDVLRSDALIRLVHDLRFGKLNPDNPAAGRNLGHRDARDAQLDEQLQRILASARLFDAIRALRPTHFIYTGLIASLAELRRIATLGPWETVPRGPAIRLDGSDPRVPTVRRQLAILGDLSVMTTGDTLKADSAFIEGVRRFQRRHALNDDGIVGPATLAELNVTPERRIEQVRINLERARWYTPDLPETFVAVNIAGAMAYMFRDGAEAWRSRAIVGRETTTTPVFRATMTHMDLNPTWTVPPGIVGEVLASIRSDSGYMERTGMRVVDSAGRRISISRSEILGYTAASFPYYFRQDAGPNNPLGLIKFLFPNRYNVYLHDTPARSLFDQEERLFSHGCVRLQDPFGLAEAILDDADRWSREDVVAAIAANPATRTIRLQTPLEVLILYWTAATEEDGELHFHRDVYGRDADVLRGLER